MKKFLGVYYEWGCYAKVTYEKMTIYTDLKKLVEGYDKYTVSYIKAQKTPVATGMHLIKSNLEGTYNIYKYILFVGQLMWYTPNVVPDVANAACGITHE